MVPVGLGCLFWEVLDPFKTVIVISGTRDECSKSFVGEFFLPRLCQLLSTMKSGLDGNRTASSDISRDLSTRAVGLIYRLPLCLLIDDKSAGFVAIFE